MSVDASLQERAGIADPALGLLSSNFGVPKQPPVVSGVDAALVRDGRIAVLHTLLTAQS